MPIEPSRKSTSPALTPHRRDGFTLPELIVALMLLTVGLLALAGTSAFLTYEYAASARAERAATLAGTRLEILRLAGCVSSQGSETSEGLTAVWSVILAGRTATASVGVAWNERGTPVVHRYATAFAC